MLAVFDRSDEEIREEIISEVIPRLSEPSWYSVMVKNGIVTVEGTPETVPIGREVLARIRHVQGVVAVRDHLPAALRHRPVALSRDRPVPTGMRTRDLLPCLGGWAPPRVKVISQPGSRPVGKEVAMTAMTDGTVIGYAGSPAARRHCAGPPGKLGPEGPC